jgi:hypothetical protein
MTSGLTTDAGLSVGSALTPRVGLSPGGGLSFSGFKSGVSPIVFQNFLTTPTLPAWLDVSGITGNRMVYDSTGTLTYAPNNLLTYGNDLTNAVWVNYYTGPTSRVANSTDVLDPIGTNTATKLVIGAVSGTANGVRNSSLGSVASGTKIAMGIYLRGAAGGEVIAIRQDDSSGWTTATLTTSWQLVSFVGTTAGGQFEITNYGTSFTGPGITIYAYKASYSQVTYESSVRSADQVITTSAAYFGPRFDYPNATAAGLLIEESRTNIALYANDLTNAAWAKTNATAALNQTGPDGVTNSASTITATAGNATVLQSVTLASSQRQMSAFVKRITGTGTVNMTTDGGSTWTAITVTGSWTRVTIPAQTVTNPNFGFQIVTNGDAIAVGYVSNEGGAFATSPIPTTSASVTRPADIIKLAGTALTTLQGSAGTLVEEVTVSGPIASNVTWMSDGTNFPLYTYSGDSNVYSWNGSTALASGQSTVYGTTPIRGAVGWDGGPNRSISVKGSAVVSAATTFGTIGGTVYLGSSNSSAFINGYVRGMSLYNSKLANATLQTKSTVGGAY